MTIYNKLEIEIIETMLPPSWEVLLTADTECIYIREIGFRLSVPIKICKIGYGPNAPQWATINEYHPSWVDTIVAKLNKKVG